MDPKYIKTIRTVRAQAKDKYISSSQDTSFQLDQDRTANEAWSWTQNFIQTIPQLFDIPSDTIDRFYDNYREDLRTVSVEPNNWTFQVWIIFLLIYTIIEYPIKRLTAFTIILSSYLTNIVSFLARFVIAVFLIGSLLYLFLSVFSPLEPLKQGIEVLGSSFVEFIQRDVFRTI